MSLAALFNRCEKFLLIKLYSIEFRFDAILRDCFCIKLINKSKTTIILVYYLLYLLYKMIKLQIHLLVVLYKMQYIYTAAPLRIDFKKDKKNNVACRYIRFQCIRFFYTNKKHTEKIFIIHSLQRNVNKLTWDTRKYSVFWNNQTN